MVTMKREGIIAVCVAMVAILCYFGMQSPEVHVVTYPGTPGDSWCDSDFAKRMDINVNNTAGSTLADYQIYVNLSSNPINESSIRVYNATSCILRPYWSENTTAGNSYGIWINYSAIAASGWTNDTSIYYNNSAVSSVSNGTNTFMFFDDFSSNLNKWTIEQAYATIESGRLNLTGAPNSNPIIRTDDTYGPLDIALDFKMQHTNETGYDEQFYGGLTDVSVWGWGSGDWALPFRKAANNYYYTNTVNSGTSTQTLTSVLATSNESLRTVGLYSGHAKHFFNNANLQDDTTNIPDSPMYIKFGHTFSGSLHYPSYYDDIRIRKYAAVVPTTTLGNEEQQTGIVLTLTTPTEGQEFSTTTIWINGTTNANATINFSVDVGANETACSDCLSFQNSTSVLSEGNHNVTVYAINYTDSSDTDTKIRNFIINSLAPQWGNQTQNVSFIYENGSINLSANGYDATGLDYAWLATNETGTWQNHTTIDTRIGVYQNLTNDYIHTAECGSHDTFTAYSELTGDYSKYLFSYAPTSNSVQSAAFSWYFPENNTWDVDHVIYNSTAADANTMVAKNETRWLYLWRDCSNHTLYEMWTNDSGNTWSPPTTPSLYPEFDNVLFVPIENDTSKAISISTTVASPNNVYKVFFYRENESYSTKEFVWTKGEAGEFGVSKVIYLNGIYYMFIASRSGGSYAKYVNSTNLTTWSSAVSTDIPQRIGVGWSVDCDKDTCYAVIANSNSPYKQELYSINKSLFTSNDWTYRLDLNVTDAWHGTLKVINDTHLIASARDHNGLKQYGILVKTHTETNSQYGSPIDLSGSTTWEWANFTWQNAAYNNTKIYWKICFNDTSGLSNCTDVMSFDITEIPTTPIISNVINGSISSTSQYVDWDVNQTSYNRVVYDNGSISAGSTACEGQWSATHACTNATDGNWSSYAESAGALLAYAKFNYTVPSSANQSESLWHVKDEIGHANLTIPSACWGATLYLRAMCSDIGNSVTWQCDNGPGWTTLHTSVANILYEEEMLFKYTSAWDNSTASPNITLSGLTGSTVYNFKAWSYNTTDTSFNTSSSTYSFTTAAELPPTNSITIAEGKRALFCNWTANTTFSNIAANLTNCTDFFYYNLTTYKWNWYNINRTINADTVIPKYESVMVSFNKSTTIDCITLSTENQYVPNNTWFFTALRGSSSKTLNQIKEDMEAS